MNAEERVIMDAGWRVHRGFDPRPLPLSVRPSETKRRRVKGAMEDLEQGLDRDAFTVGTHDDGDARRCWRARTGEDRLAALEFLRQVMYGYDPAADRIQRVLETAELGGR
jgi:hypothetical protein